MKNWSYHNHRIQEGLKPGSTKFRYFFRISENNEKKCNYCVWITKDALSRFDSSGNFDTIISSNQAGWQQWVKEKIDAGDFRDRAWVFDKNGDKEIDFSKINEHVSLD